MSATIDQIVGVIGAAAVTPSNTVDLPKAARALYIGTGGDVKVACLDGTTPTFVGVPSGVILPVSCTRVYTTGTGATNILALF